MDKPNTIRIAVNSAIIAGIFSVVMSLLILFNYFQLTGNDPIESETMKSLVERLNSDPKNEQLMNEIRAFDLLARKAFFTAKWQIETGGVLLLIAVVVLVISLRYYFSAISKIDEPETVIVPENTARILTSKWVLGTGILLFVIALGASLLSVDRLSDYTPDQKPDRITTSQDEQHPIEVVDLSTPEIVETVNVTSSEETTEGEEAVTNLPVSPVVSKYPSVDEIRKQANSFRGPFGQGVFFSKNIPSSWDVAAGTGVKWKVKVPKKGYNSPVIWGEKLFITGADLNERGLYCYDRTNGNLLWEHRADNIAGSPPTPPKTTDDTGLAAPSATTDGKTVVALFGTGDLLACDYSGKRLWAKNLGVPANHYGHSSSLIYWNGKVLVQYDTNKGSKLMAFDIDTGNRVWETARTSHISWASPILARVGETMQVITSSEPTVAGYDAETGRELWKNDCMMGEVGPSPAFGNGLVFAANEYATLAAINPENGEKVWEDNDYLPEVASPVAYDGLLFIGTTYGVLACYDAHTGNKYWEQEYGEGFYSSPVIADGKLYATDMNGVVHILKVSREAETIGDFSMGEKVMSTPSFHDGAIYIRGVEHLYCIGK